MKYLFLQKDLDFLKKEHEVLLKRHQDIGQDMREACAQSSETWHDNAPYDDALDNAKLTENRLMQLGDIFINAKLVVFPKKPFKKVKIGNIVKVIDGEENEKDYEVGSYVTYEENKKEKGIQLISYNSPLGMCLLNKKIGDTCVLNIGGQEKKLKVLEIK